MLSILIAVALFAQPQAAEVVGSVGGIAGLGAWGYIAWLTERHRTERREWREADTNREEKCDRRIEAANRRIDDLWTRLERSSGGSGPHKALPE